MHPEPLVAGAVVRGRAEHLRHVQRAAGLVVERGLVPGQDPSVANGEYPDPRASQLVVDALDPDVRVVVEGRNPPGNVDGDVVAAGDRDRVALVEADADDHAGNVPVRGQQVVQPRRVEGLEHPHAAVVADDRVPGSLEGLVRVREPADSRLVAVDLDQPAFAPRFQRHGGMARPRPLKRLRRDNRIVLTSCDHLALEVKYLDRARRFYADALGLAPDAVHDREVRYAVGETDLVLRRPHDVPRGGLHVHYALSCPPDRYEDWASHLAPRDPEEVSFGAYSSLYVDDPDDHCVEVGGVPSGDDSDGTGEAGDADDGTASDRDADEGTASDRDVADATDATDTEIADAPALTGLFEVVLEVESLAPAEDRYTALGFDVVDRGEQRRRVRLRGPFDLELWEPQLGLADARGGVHVDLGLRATDPAAAVETLGDDVVASEPVEGGVRVRDADGHWLTFRAD